ncbi:hypothetical protein [Maritalea mediterranea]|uniref:Uncharacterized protein n=1 Tax=Maritalea mediterranea TaxID=2909667 RepID=A0ABS9E951_9HYPH|nr:hypothetical protein [Maritalea mediterranea]MCF4099398.1 hypothetical protein [Maritalea mediterranea]
MATEHQNNNVAHAPMVIEAQSHQARRRHAYRPEAHFVAHLLTQRQNLSPNRRQMRPGAFAAQSAYRANAERIIKRMPAGYNRTVDA